MKYTIYDISQELLTSQVYPGDEKPSLKILKDIDNNELYNLTSLYMSSHNGTHVDAPLHFLKDGKSIGQINLKKFIGMCFVISYEGIVTKEAAINIMNSIKEKSLEKIYKILLKGNAIVSSEAATVFASYNLDLLGTELLSIGDVDSPMEIHKILLSKEVVLLEGLRLNKVEDGEYFLNCAPLYVGKAEGAPCRAILIKFE